MNEVILAKYEILMAAEVGMRRKIISLDSPDTLKETNDNLRWQIDIEGACAELAVAKHLNLYWDGSVNTFKKPDVGEYQVRHTTRNNGRLIVRQKDADNEVYILVTGLAPVFNVVGWMVGGEAKADKYKMDDYSWFVPQSELKSIAELK